MSEKTGKLVTCDRCGASIFRERIGEGEADGGFTRWNKFEPLPEGWDYRVSKMLCPECSTVFQDLVAEFMNGGGAGNE